MQKDGSRREDFEVDAFEKLNRKHWKAKIVSKEMED